MKRFSRRYLHETLDLKHGDIPLLVMCFTTGLLDAPSYNEWGVFVGMQTGNTILLGLSTASLPQGYTYSYATTLTSLGSFMFGAYWTQLVSRHVNKHSRIFLSSCFLVQAALLMLAAILASVGLVPDDPRGTGDQLSNSRILTVIPPLAMQFGVQMATSRIMGFGELPSNVLTSSFTDLMGDVELFQWKRSPKRDRRLGSVVLVLGGAIAGAWMMRDMWKIMVQIWIAVVLKVVCAVGVWGVMGTKEEKESLPV